MTDESFRIVNIIHATKDMINNSSDKFIGKHILSFININLQHKNGTAFFNSLPIKYTIIDNINEDGFIVHISNSIYYNDFYQKILDILDIGIHITDKSGYIAFTNKAAEKGEFLNRHLSTGKHITDVYPLTVETSCLLRALNNPL